MIVVHGRTAFKVGSVILRLAGVTNMNVVQGNHLSDLDKLGRRERVVSAPKICAVLRGDNRDLDSPGYGTRVGIRPDRTRKPDPSISVVCFRVRAGSIERAFDGVRGTRYVSATPDRRKRWSD